MTEETHVATEAVPAWTTPRVVEICLGMEVTSYESADVDTVD
ncbi:pyrroloquinoline quinone precursor peptide PqqA [Xanthobacter autotrophicus]